jgi:HEAT repeat protein
MDPLNTALAELEHSDRDIRERALDTIGTLNPQNAFEIIAPFLSDPDPAIRETAACNLGDIQDDRSIPVLINLAENDAIETVRAEALQALANYQSPEILQCLIDEINRKKQSRRPRQIIARQLQHYINPQSLEALAYLLLNDDDVHVRIASADSLSVIQESILGLSHHMISDETSIHGNLKFHTIWQRVIEVENESTYIINLANEAQSKLIRDDRFFGLAPVMFST